MGYDSGKFTLRHLSYELSPDLKPDFEDSALLGESFEATLKQSLKCVYAVKPLLSSTSGKTLGGAESSAHFYPFGSDDLIVLKEQTLKASHRDIYGRPLKLFESKGVKSPYIDIPIAVASSASDSRKPAFKISKRAQSDAMEIVSGALSSNKDKQAIFNYHRNFACQMLQALAALHAKNLVHRDVKPDNVLYYRDNDGKDLFKLTDHNFVCETGEDGNGFCDDKTGYGFSMVYFPAIDGIRDNRGKITDKYFSLNFKALDLYALGFSLLLSLYLHSPEDNQRAIYGKMKNHLGLNDGDAEFIVTGFNQRAKKEIGFLLREDPYKGLACIKQYYNSRDISKLCDLIEGLLDRGGSFPGRRLSKGDAMAQKALCHPVFKLTPAEEQGYNHGINENADVLYQSRLNLKPQKKQKKRRRRQQSRRSIRKELNRRPKYLYQLQRGEHSSRVGIDGYWVDPDYVRHTPVFQKFTMAEQKPEQMNADEWRALHQHLHTRPKEKPEGIAENKWERLQKKWQAEKDHSVQTSAKDITEVTDEDWGKWKARSDIINDGKEKLFNDEKRKRSRDRLFYQLPAELKAIVAAYENLESAGKILDDQLVTRKWCPEQNCFILDDKQISNVEKLIIRNKIGEVSAAIEQAKNKHADHPVWLSFNDKLAGKLEAWYQADVLKISELDPERDDAVLSQCVAEMLRRGDEIVAASKAYKENSQTAKANTSPEVFNHGTKYKAVMPLFVEALEKLAKTFAYKQPPKQDMYRLFQFSGEQKELTFGEKLQLLNDVLSPNTWVASNSTLEKPTKCEKDSVAKLLGGELVGEIEALDSADVTRIRVYLKQVFIDWLADGLYSKSDTGDITLEVEKVLHSRAAPAAKPF